MTLVDGGPDENIRFLKTLGAAIDRLRKYDLDVYVATTHIHLECQPNYVERWVDPLSRELAGIILPHDAFGSH